MVHGLNELSHRPQNDPRHAYGVNAILKGVPVTILQKWMGHARLKTTALYVDVVGAEQHDIAARMQA